MDNNYSNYNNSQNGLSKSNSDTCIICMESNSELYLGCSHKFCKKCIERWYEIDSTCPTCRRSITPCRISSVQLPGQVPVQSTPVVIQVSTNHNIHDNNNINNHTCPRPPLTRVLMTLLIMSIISIIFTIIMICIYTIVLRQ
jgi:hypothetical protein